MNREQIEALANAMTVKNAQEALEACKKPNPKDYEWTLFCMQMHNDVIEQEPDMKRREKIMEQQSTL